MLFCTTANSPVYAQTTASTKNVWQSINIKTSSQCGACKERIETTFYKQKGVKKAVLNLKTDVLKVQFNSNVVTALALKTVLQKIGYDADELVADPVAYEKLPACCKKGGHD